MKRKAQTPPEAEDYRCLNCGKPIALVTMTTGAAAGQQVWVHISPEGAQRLSALGFTVSAPDVLGVELDLA